MQHAGSLEFTRGVLEALYSELEGEMGRLEGEFGVGVLELRRVVEKLKV